MKNKNLFVWGLTGSGKDTITNHICKSKSHRKVRLAKTIKSVICETQNLTPDELEEQKRENAFLRKQHVVVSNTINNFIHIDEEIQFHNLNRLQQLVNKTSIDFEMLDEEEIKRPLMFCDVRGHKEVEALLESGAVGYFLMRKSKNSVDNVNKGDWTEEDLFDTNPNTKIKPISILLLKYPKQIFVVDNTDVEVRQLEVAPDNFLLFEEPTVTAEILLNKIDTTLN